MYPASVFSQNQTWYACARDTTSTRRVKTGSCKLLRISAGRACFQFAVQALRQGSEDIMYAAAELVAKVYETKTTEPLSECT